MSTQVATRASPHKLTQHLIGAVAREVRAGGNPVDALRTQGVSQRAAEDWLQRGRGDHPTRTAIPPYTTLADAVDKAESEYVVAQERAISADEDWRARAKALSTKRAAWRDNPPAFVGESPVTAMLEGFAAAMKLAAGARAPQEDARDDGLVIEQAPRLDEGVAEGDERG